MGSHARATVDRSALRSRTSSGAARLRRLSRSAPAPRQRSSSRAISSSRSAWLATGSAVASLDPPRLCSLVDCSAGTPIPSAPVELGVDYVIVRHGPAAVAVAGWLSVAVTGWGRLQAIQELLQLRGQRLDSVEWCFLLDGLAGIGDPRLRARPVMGRGGLTELAKPPLHLVCHRIKLIARFDRPAELLVVLAMRFGLGNHP